jgi:hypothetical protein
MSVKTIANQLEENITNNFNTYYWLYGLYEKINNNERWHHNIYEELLFKSIKMDGMSVNIILTIINNKYIGLNIESDRIFNSDLEEMTSYNNEMLVMYATNSAEPLVFYNYINSLIKVDIILRKYKFDKFSGKFVDLENICPCVNHNALKRKALVRITKNNENIKTNCYECVVCYETTTNVTSCRHVVCLYCLDRIAQSINIYDQHLTPAEQPILCPICRNDINNDH